MKYFLKLLGLLFILLSIFPAHAQNWALERTVQIRAEVQESPAQITLKWESSSYTTGQRLFRRAVGSNDWGTAIATLTASDSSYTDTDVSLNTAYEYLINRDLSLTEPYSSSGATVITNAGIYSGIKLAPKHTRGNMLILITQSLMDSLGPEMMQLRKDLLGDGWSSEVRSVIDTATVSEIAEIIEEADSIDALYLIGQLAYPYSGVYCRPANYQYPPDGHHETAGGHCGAWIADAYYGSLDEAWTDNLQIDNATREENDNYIGDGKFDNMQLPGQVKIQIGRVDLSRLPAIGGTEVELTRHYLQKAHDYRITTTNVLKKAVIENNFAGSREGFSSAAIRDFYSHLGPGETINADLFTTTAGDNYLFSYVCGPGSFTSCGGVGTTASFATNNPGMFTHMFGSWFGDFDEENNIARASLAAPQGGLSSVWSGRPKWQTQGLAMGEHMGLTAIRTQNNLDQYGFSFYQNYAHVALLGDPSLRSSMIAPPSDVQISMNGAKTQVYLSWTASSSSNITGYYVYWSDEEFGEYKLLTPTPVATAGYNHFTPMGGDNYYMIRAERLETTASGSYYNLSQAAHALASGVLRTASQSEINPISFTVYPNPFSNKIRIRCKSNESIALHIVDILGQKVYEQDHLLDGQEIDLTGLAVGTYFVVAGGQRSKLIKH